MKKLIVLLILMIGITTAADPWLRMDMDSDDGFYTYAGISVPFESLILVQNIIMYQESGNFEFEIGTIIPVIGEKFEVMPIASFYHNIRSGSIDYLVPELMFYSRFGKLYTEAWDVYIHGIGNEKGKNSFYGRYFSIYTLTKWVAVGPHCEFTLDFSDEAPELLKTMKVGGAMKFPYTDDCYYLVFAGSDIENGDKFVTRHTFGINF